MSKKNNASKNRKRLQQNSKILRNLSLSNESVAADNAPEEEQTSTFLNAPQTPGVSPDSVSDSKPPQPEEDHQDQKDPPEDKNPLEDKNKAEDERRAQLKKLLGHDPGEFLLHFIAQAGCNDKGQIEMQLTNGHKISLVRNHPKFGQFIGMSNKSEDFDQLDAKAVIATALSEGWKSINLHGSTAEKEMMWLEAMRADLPVKNFTPSPESAVYKVWQQESKGMDMPQDEKTKSSFTGISNTDDTVAEQPAQQKKNHHRKSHFPKHKR